MLNHYHSDACEGCAGWRGMYEAALAKLGQANVRAEMAEARVELTTIDHARDRREMGERIMKANAVIDQYRNLVGMVWQAVKAGLGALAPVYEKAKAEAQRLAEPPDAQFGDWMDPNQAPPKRVPEQYRHAPYGPGPRSGHLNLPPLPPELELRDYARLGRAGLPGMVPGSAGERVVKCGPACAEGHSYSEATGCLLSLPRTPGQEQRYPSHREAMMEGLPERVDMGDGSAL